MASTFIELHKVNKIYNQGLVNEVHALFDVNLQIEQESMVCLKGASGSGKSTLLAIIGCVFPPTRGKALVNGKLLSRLPDRFMTIHRRQNIGFIFQHFNILPYLTVRDNIVLPLLPVGVPLKEQRKRADSLMEMLSLTHRADFLANQVSGGELQRVAIARALIHDPPIILADEPTAHLDKTLSLAFMEIMSKLQSNGKTIILASHDPLITEHASVERIIGVTGGRLDVS